MKIIVQKYGGSSLATLAKIDDLAVRISQRAQGQDRLVLVVSAMGDATDDLVKMARTLSPQPPARELDMLLATGEQVSIALMAIALAHHGTDAISFTGAQVGIRTSRHHTKAKVVGVSPDRILAALSEKRVVIVAGFQGVTEHEDVTTLGRGGSDITAIALAVALKASHLEKYTDRDGVSCADPSYWPAARRIPRMSYLEMLEMSHTGAQIVHPRAVFLAWKYRVPILVRESATESEGTWIEEVDRSVEEPVISGVTQDTGVAKITLYSVPDKPGAASRIFEVLSEREIAVDMITQSSTVRAVNDISFTVRRADLEAAVAALEALGKEMPGIEVRSDAKVARISLVGLGIRSSSQIPSAMFKTLAEEGINIQMIATSDVTISCIVSEVDVRSGVQALCRRFFV